MRKLRFGLVERICLLLPAVPCRPRIRTANEPEPIDEMSAKVSRMLVRRPRGPLNTWVTTLWMTCERSAGAPYRERLIPTGGVHLVLRLDGPPIRIFDDLHAQHFDAAIGGARSRFHLREVPQRARSVGMMIRPGAAGVLFGIPASEFAERHTSLEEVWGNDAHALRDRLLETRSATQLLDRFEHFVSRKLCARRAPHPAVSEALHRFGSGSMGWQVRLVQRDSGLSHRRFIELFRRDVGLSPKRFCRVLRLGRALQLAKQKNLSWAAIAAAAGYSDQAHLVRDFREICGLAPTEWAALSGPHALHVPEPSPSGVKRAIRRPPDE